jgi:Icc-related predicted phosphoesterase
MSKKMSYSSFLIRLISALFFLFFSAEKIIAQDTIPTPGKVVAYISDTQAPMWIEEAYLKSNRNTEATRILINDIAKLKPMELYFLGDITNLSCRNDRWVEIDSCLVVCQENGVPVHACLGNHELMKRKKTGEENFQSRFPDHVNTGYTVISDSVATIFLNSNFSKMTKAQISKQDAWYKNEINKLDSSDAVKVIVVCCHHSPYSDSKLVGSSVQVQQKFVPAYISSRKAKLFITGHAHLFQHFFIKGKDFLVIGGGGGLNHPEKKKPGLYADLSKDYKPMFHYLTLERFPNHLQIISRRLKKDFSGVETGLKFDVGIE